MKQVLWNLLENAANASPAGAVVALHTRRDGGKIAIDVIDQGSGIAAADLPRVFEPFFTTKAPGQGTGLGLAIARSIVVEHGGSVRLQSLPGQGTTVLVQLPRCRALKGVGA